MSRYIDAEWLKKRINTAFWAEIGKVIHSAPSIDIVRCGECKAHNDVNLNPAHIMCGYMSDDDFCSYGEREGE